MQHSAPRYLSYERRTPVEFLAQTVSLMVRDREDLDQYAYRTRLDQVLDRLMVAIGRHDNFHEALTVGEPNLLSVIDAEGAALIADGQLTLLGRTPSPEQIAGLSTWLLAQDGAVLATHHLAHDYPGAEDLRATASGLLSIRLSRTSADRVIWFRPELVREVHWAGDPGKPVEIDRHDREIRLRPRTSFALWRETVYGQSRPWLSCEVDYALRLKHAIFDVIVERAKLLVQINAELERSNLELDSFAYAASHDLKEPLRGIHHFAEFLQTEEGGQLSARARQRLATILRLAGRMDDLLESLLQYSRVGRNQLDLRPQAMDGLVREIAQELRQGFPDADIALEIQPRLPVIPCDRVQVGMILRNLLVNAVKYNDQPVKQVHIGCDLSRNPPAFFVRDNGIGIDPEYQPLIFQLFRRLHGRDEYGGGAGAGLTIAKKAARRHGGSLWVESSLGGGSTFFFTLAPERATVPQVP
jgi:light-regulated signal transduction histidine kinase (bacteriophytochrome)